MVPRGRIYKNYRRFFDGRFTFAEFLSTMLRNLQRRIGCHEVTVASARIFLFDHSQPSRISGGAREIRPVFTNFSISSGLMVSAR